MYAKLPRILATWFGCGSFPKAPGTIGSLGSLPLVWLFMQLPPIGYMAGTLMFSAFAIFVAHIYEVQSGIHDSKEVVIDEVAGMLVPMTWVPFNWPFVFLGFCCFERSMW